MSLVIISVSETCVRSECVKNQRVVERPTQNISLLNSHAAIFNTEYNGEDSKVDCSITYP